jgi:hypothetical protein
MNKLKEKVRSIRYLPIKEFKKRFSEMYDFANDDEKEEIIRLFEEGVDEHISKVDSFIEETRMMMKLDEEALALV